MKIGTKEECLQPKTPNFTYLATEFSTVIDSITTITLILGMVSLKNSNVQSQPNVWISSTGGRV